MELQLTWGRLIRFWWAAAWRSVIFANLFGGALAGIMGITLSLLGHKNLEGDLANLFLDAMLLAWIPGFLFAIRSALRLPYRDFRIVLIPPASKL